MSCALSNIYVFIGLVKVFIKLFSILKLRICSSNSLIVVYRICKNRLFYNEVHILNTKDKAEYCTVAVNLKTNIS